MKTTCEGCGRTINDNGAQTAHLEDGAMFCSTCARDMSMTCRTCGTVAPAWDMYSAGDDEAECESCHKMTEAK